jgi:diguanylate cyclase (GGDEF)-like protein
LIGDHREARPRSAGTALNILVVDDDEDARKGLRLAIMAIGHRCAVAADGEEAWEMHRAHPADVIIADWVMPRLSGVELCRRTRAHDGDAYTYFILLSGLTDKEHFLEGMSAGADDYLDKPVDLDELGARLVTAGRVVALQRRLAAKNLALRKDSQQNFAAARLDPLTNLANRRQLSEDLERIFATPYRFHHSVAIADIDFFKRYNDRFGHQAGDEALRRVASAMRGSLRRGDMLYRYGGEEFLIILKDLRAAPAATAVERLRRAVQDLQIPHPEAPAGVVTISAGVAELLPEVETSDEWLYRADAALYRAKAGGRNRVELGRTSKSTPPQR